MVELKPRQCRVCHQTLTLDNIYPSDLKYQNWRCKSCRDLDKRERQDKRDPPVDPQVDPIKEVYNTPSVVNELLDILNCGVINKSGSTANHVRCDVVKPIQPAMCCDCKAYNRDDSTCHLNPPTINSFPKVDPIDYCLQFIMR